MPRGADSASDAMLGNLPRKPAGAASRPRRAAAHRRTGRRPMPFTGYLVHGSFALGLALALARPILGWVPESGALKHLALMGFILSLSVHAIGMAAANDRRIYTRGMGRALWPFLLLGLFATVGSLYARIALSQEDTFLTLGLYLLALPLFFLWGRDERNGTAVVKPLMVVWLLISLGAIVGSVVQRERENPLHESEFLVLPIFLYWYLVSRTRIGRAASVVMLIVASVLTGKITGYVIGLCALLTVVGMYVWQNTSTRHRSLILALSAIGILAAAGASVGAYFHFRDHMPSGNARVRLHQYRIVYQEFLDSPIWGAAYAGPSGVTFVEAGVPLNIPTHSDVLDVLREGGVLGCCLWLTGVIRSVKTLATRMARNREAQAYLAVMLFSLLATVFSYGFNPLLLKPPQAFVIWGMLGIALSVATDRRPGQLNGA